MIRESKERTEGNMTTVEKQNADIQAARIGAFSDFGGKLFQSALFPILWASRAVPAVILYFNPENNRGIEGKN